MKETKKKEMAKKTVKKKETKLKKEDKRIQDLEEIVIGMGARMTILENLCKRISKRMEL